MNKNKLLLSNEEGSIAILVAFLLTIFIGFMGLAVDFSYAYLQKTRLQKVADAEALACVISPVSAPCPANGTNLYPERSRFCLKQLLLLLASRRQIPHHIPDDYCHKSVSHS